MVVATNLKNGELLKALEQRFEMKDLGNVEYVLGMKIRRDRANRHVYVSQESYIRKALRTFGMDSAETKPASVPGTYGKKLRKEDGGVWSKDRDNPPPYRELVGTLMYAVVTRPDIAHACGLVARFCGNPGETHWLAAKQILRYLKGTAYLELRLGGRSPLLYCYSDADWNGSDNAAPTDTHCCVSGGVLFWGDGPVEYFARKQAVPALSTCEAEFRAASFAVQYEWYDRVSSYLSLCSGVCGVIGLRTILGEIGFTQEEPTVVFVDNLSCKAAMINPINKKLRHVNAKIHRVRFAIKDGDVQPIYVQTDHMIADILTKNLPEPRFRYLRGLIMGYAVPTDAESYAGEPKPALPTRLKERLGY